MTRIADVTRDGRRILRAALAHHDTFRPGWLRRLWHRIMRPLLPCPICNGTKVEYFDVGGKIGPQIIVCSMCNGVGTYSAYERIRQADIAAINAPARCRCPGEWDRY